MRDRRLRFIGYFSLVLISMLPPVAAGSLRDTRTPHTSPETNGRLVAGLELIAGLPEPQAIVLLGTALLVGSGIARRRVTRHGKVPEA